MEKLKKLAFTNEQNKVKIPVFNSTQNTQNTQSIFSDSAKQSALVDKNFNKSAQTDVLSAEKPEATKPCGSFINGILDIIYGTDDERDGEISGTKQRMNGDCWLLAGINSLSYTEEGRKAISEALDYQDGYTLVHFKGLNMSFPISDEKLEDVKNDWLGLRYSTGDDDMIIFELAMEMALDRVASNDVVFDPNHTPWYIEDADDLQTSHFYESSIWGGFEGQVWYFLTGKLSHFSSDKEEMNKFLDEFQTNNGKDIVLGCFTREEDNGKKFKDINGKTHKLAGPHAYSIKTVTDDTVTVINPWNSDEEIVISRDEFLNSFYYMEKCDISDPTHIENVYNTTYTFDEFGNKNFTFDCSDVTFHDDEGNIVHYAKQVEKYSKDGEYLSSTYLDENGNPVKVVGHLEIDNGFDGKETVANKEVIEYKDGKVVYYYDENNKIKSIEFQKKNGKVKSRTFYSDNGESAIYTKYGITGKIKEQYLCLIADEAGYPKSYIPGTTKEVIENISSRGLLNYPNLSGEEIYYYASLTDGEWEKVKYTIG